MHDFPSLKGRNKRTISIHACLIQTVNKLLATNLSPSDDPHPLNQRLEPTRTRPRRMRANPPLIKQPLHNPEKRVRELAELRVRRTPIRRGPCGALARDPSGQDPVRLYDLAGRLVFRVRVEGRVAAACAADGGVADFHGLLLRDAVEGVGELVFAVGFDVLGAGGGVVVEGCFGAEGFDKGEILGGAGCDGFETAPVWHQCGCMERCYGRGDIYALRS